MKISLCLMTWNEIDGCKMDVPRLPLSGFDEVFCVDGGSTDGTVEFMKSFGIPVYLQPRKGLNAAYLHANHIATGAAIVVFFPKGTIPVSDLLNFRPLFEIGNQLIVASRQIPGSSNEEDHRWWRPRKWAVWWLSFIAMLSWRREGYWIRDVLHGCKGFTRDSFRQMSIRHDGLTIDLEMIVQSYRLKLKRCEFPTKETKRPHGTTHFKIWPTGKQMLRYLIREWFS